MPMWKEAQCVPLLYISFDTSKTYIGSKVFSRYYGSCLRAGRRLARFVNTEKIKSSQPYHPRFFWLHILIYIYIIIFLDQHNLIIVYTYTILYIIWSIIILPPPRIESAHHSLLHTHTQQHHTPDTTHTHTHTAWRLTQILNKNNNK